MIATRSVLFTSCSLQAVQKYSARERFIAVDAFHVVSRLKNPLIIVAVKQRKGVAEDILSRRVPRLLKIDAVFDAYPHISEERVSNVDTRNNTTLSFVMKSSGVMNWEKALSGRIP